PAACLVTFTHSFSAHCGATNQILGSSVKQNKDTSVLVLEGVAPQYADNG
ncbi:15592_t:CDS:1, partial [Gigaspora rosea]